MAEDVLSWLLPEVGEDERARARRLVTALRLVRDAARAGAHAPAAPAWTRATGELERLERARRLQALTALLHAYLEAALPADSFLDLGPAPLAYDEAWRRWLEAGAGAPRPCEGPCTVVERLLGAPEALAAPPGWRERWDACRVHVFEGAERGEARWSELLRAAGEARGRHAERLVGLVAARLDRFDPRGAWALCAGARGLVDGEPRLARLATWSALFAGETAAAAELAARAGLSAGRVPLPALELAEAVEEWRPFFPGAACERGLAPHAPSVMTRRELGAALLGVFAAGESVALRLEAAPAARASAERAAVAPGEVERAFEQGAPLVRRHRLGEGALAGALAGPRSRALALVPIHSDAGQLLGWLHVESEHHLLPARPRLAALAAAWAAELAARQRPASAPRPAGADANAPRSTGVRRAPFAPDDPRRACFAELVAELVGRTARRRVYLVEREAEARFAVRAEHGGALADWAVQPGGARALARHRAGPVSFGQPAPELALHARAGSGVVLALTPAARGPSEILLVLESERRRDFPGRELERLEAGLRARAQAWRAAAFRAWHRRRFGGDLAWDPRSSYVTAIEAELPGAAAGTTPLLLLGRAGAGRRVLARRLHFEGERRDEPFVEGTAASELVSRGTRVVDLAALTPEEQRRLAGASGERLLVLSTLAPQAARERGALLAELERRLDPLPLVVPSLCDRRDEIPGLCRVLAAEVARREGLAPVRFEDDALAELWRQDWRGEVRELGSFVAHLARAQPGRAIDGAAVRAAARVRRLELRARLASRRPRTLDLELALRATRHRSGAWNRARAARYLGWDPDTLAARLAERGHELGPELAPEPRAGPGSE